MQYSVEKNYLVFPVSTNAKPKVLKFYRGSGECAFSITLRLDYCTPQQDVYVDMKRFKGEFLDVTAEPYMRLDMRAKDRRPVCRFSESLRPHYHLTAPEGAMSAPFSAVYSAGMYHIFYGNNPFGTERGNTHIGHAASRNLVDFEYCSQAVFPDCHSGVHCGSILCDEKNLMSARNSEKTPVVFYYISGSERETADGQYDSKCEMAVSNDGCASFMKMPFEVMPDEEKNVKNSCVVYSTRYDTYILITQGDGVFPLYSSKNLKSWKKLGEIIASGIGECPMLFPMVVGETEEKWVLMDRDGRYVVGDFDSQSFSFESSVQTFNYSAKGGCGICRVPTDTGERTLCFMNMPTPLASFGTHFDGAMSFPMEMRLVRTPAGDRVYVNPAKEIDRLCGKKVKENVRTESFGVPLRGIAQDLRIELLPTGAKKADIGIFGERFELDIERSVLTCCGRSMPVCTDDDCRIRIRILCDTCGFEVYTAGGAAYMALCCVPDENFNVLEVCSDSEIVLKLEAIRLRDSRRSDKRR